MNLPGNLAGRTGIAPALAPEAITAAVGALPLTQAYTIVGQKLNMIAANASQAFDFNGPAFTVDTACSSALSALHGTTLHLRHGTEDAALVGGVYVQLDPTMMVCFSRIGTLSFSDHCRPFQAAADGFVFAEGAGMVALKRLGDAQRDGDRVIAILRGVAMNNDGRGTGPLTPNATGQAAAIAEAWRTAGCDRTSVGLIEAHAIATPAGDGIGLDALTSAFAS
ncbi:MAG: polyketide synthase [Undibacterium sp.]|nr:polyketide synthase [Opitutaceae bacterium]